MLNDLDTRTTLDWISAAQAAGILGVNRATITRWASNGALPTAFKSPGVRGNRLFDRTAVEGLARKRLDAREQAVVQERARVEQVA